MQTVWYYPNEVYVDKELLNKARYVKVDSEFGLAAHIQLFSGVWERRGEGGSVCVWVFVSVLCQSGQ